MAHSLFFLLKTCLYHYYKLQIAVLWIDLFTKRKHDFRNFCNHSRTQNSQTFKNAFFLRYPTLALYTK